MKYQVVLSTFIFTGLLSFFVGSPAWGGACAAIAEAFKKADKQERMGTRSEGGGFLKGFGQDGEKRIGKVKCLPSTDIVVTYSCEEAKDPDFLSPVGKGRAQIYLAGEKGGEFKCRSLGTDKVDGEMADKYELTSMMEGSVLQREVYWISTKTGLPLAQDTGLTVTKYFYGTAVKDCDCKKK